MTEHTALTHFPWFSKDECMEQVPVAALVYCLPLRISSILVVEWINQGKSFNTEIASSEKRRNNTTLVLHWRWHKNISETQVLLKHLNFLFFLYCPGIHNTLFMKIAEEGKLPVVLNMQDLGDLMWKLTAQTFWWLLCWGRWRKVNNQAALPSQSTVVNRAQLLVPAWGLETISMA